MMPSFFICLLLILYQGFSHMSFLFKKVYIELTPLHTKNYIPEISSL